MGIEKVINFAVTVVMAVALAGQLPKFTRMIQKAQVQLLWESRASNWGNPNIFIPKRPRRN